MNVSVLIARLLHDDAALHQRLGDGEAADRVAAQRDRGLDQVAARDVRVVAADPGRVVEVLQPREPRAQQALELLGALDAGAERLAAGRGERADRGVGRGEQVVARAGGDVLAERLLHQLGVDAPLAPVDQAGLLQAAGQLVRGLDGDVGAGVHRRGRQLGVEVQVPAPGLVDEEHRLRRRVVDGGGDRVRVRAQPLVRGRGVDDGERLRVAAQPVEHLVDARRQHRLELRVVGRGQEAEVEPERLDRVDRRVVAVARDEDQGVRPLEREHAQHDEVGAARAVDGEHRPVGVLGLRGEALGLPEHARVVDERPEEARRDGDVGGVEVLDPLLVDEGRGRAPAVVVAHLLVEDAHDR